MASPFDYVNSVNNKKYLDPESKDYVPFIVNRSFSFIKDTIFFANEMNQRPSLSKTCQYDFYYYGLPASKRWGKWAKKIKTDNIKNVQEYYQCSYRKAVEIVKILTKPQLKAIAKALEKGG
jgi:hypothetical protein